MKLLKRKWFIISILLASVFIFFTIGSNNIQVDCPTIIENKTEIIKKGVVKLDDKSYNYELLRLKGDNKPSYAIYIKNTRPETIMITRPYAEISWACEEADKKRIKTVSVYDTANDSSIYLYNGFSVLNVFGRFYEGGDIENDISDMLAGLDFLKGKKVGITGSSWGGFEAIYAAAKTKNKPVVGTAYYPPTDMETWLKWSKITNEDFFKPYQERCELGSNGDYTNWSHDFLNKNLKTNFLIFHAYEDTLVPVEQTIKLGKLTDKVTPILSHKIKDKLSHGKDSEESLIPFEYTVLTAYLMRGLTKDTITTLADIEELKKIKDSEVIKVLNDAKLIIFEPTEKRVLEYKEFKEILNKE